MIDLKKVRHIAQRYKTLQLQKSLSDYSGQLRSKFRGQGLQFKEHFLYVPGDDIRFIDWKLTARSQRLYVKSFEEERNLDIHVFLDISESMFLRQENKSKLEAYLESIALLYLIFEKTKDFLTVHLFFESLYSLPQLSGMIGFSTFLNLLKKVGLYHDSNIVAYTQVKKYPLENKIKEITRWVSKKKEVIIFSEFEDLNTKLEQLLKKNQCHPFRYLVELEIYKNEAIRIPSAEGLLSLNSEKAMNDENKLIRSILMNDQYLESFGHYL